MFEVNPATVASGVRKVMFWGVVLVVSVFAGCSIRWHWDKLNEPGCHCKADQCAAEK